MKTLMKVAEKKQSLSNKMLMGASRGGAAGAVLGGAIGAGSSLHDDTQFNKNPNFEPRTKGQMARFTVQAGGTGAAKGAAVGAGIGAAYEGIKHHRGLKKKKKNESK